jgi:hypothetical protein
MMNVFRRMGQGVVAGILALGLVTPTSAAGTVKKLDLYDLGNNGQALQVETTVGESGTFVTASRTPEGNLRMQAFYTNASHQFVDDSSHEYGAIGDVDVANLGNINSGSIGNGLVVAAVRLKTNNTLKLIAFDANGGADGHTLNRLGDIDYTKKQITLGGNSEVEIARTGQDGVFVTTGLTPDFKMTIDTWKVSSGGASITWLSNYTTDAVFDRIALTGDHHVPSRRFVTAIRKAPEGKLWMLLWETDASGKITKVDTKYRGSVERSSVTLSGNRMYVSNYNDAGNAEIQYWDVTLADGRIQMLHRAEATLPIAVDSAEVVDMGDVSVVVVRGKYHDLTPRPLKFITYTFNGSALKWNGTLLVGDQTDSYAATLDGEDRFFISYVSPQEPNRVTHSVWRYTDY